MNHYVDEHECAICDLCYCNCDCAAFSLIPRGGEPHGNSAHHLTTPINSPQLTHQAIWLAGSCYINPNNGLNKRRSTLRLLHTVHILDHTYVNTGRTVHSYFNTRYHHYTTPQACSTSPHLTAPTPTIIIPARQLPSKEIHYLVAFDISYRPLPRLIQQENTTPPDQEYSPVHAIETFILEEVVGRYESNDKNDGYLQ